MEACPLMESCPCSTPRASAGGTFPCSGHTSIGCERLRENGPPARDRFTSFCMLSTRPRAPSLPGSRRRESTPMVDCRGGAPQFPHLKHRLKRREMERLRSQEIDTENMILLHKMRSIFRDGTVATNSGLPKPVEVLPRSLNQEARRRELERISRENLEIVQRIRASKPCYSATKQLSDQQEREAILKRISRHGRRRLDVFSPSSSTASLLSSGTFGSTGSSRSITALGRSRSMATQLMSYYEPQAGGPQYGDELGEPSAASLMLNVDELRPTPMRLKPLHGGGKGKMAPASADFMPPPPPPMHVGDKPRTPLYAARPEPSPLRGPSLEPAPAPTKPAARAPAPAAPTAAAPAPTAPAPAAPTASAPAAPALSAPTATAPTATAQAAPVPAAPEAAAAAAVAAAAVAAAAVAAAVAPPAAALAATPAPATAAVEPPPHAVNVAIDFQDSSRPQSRGLQLKLYVPDGVGPAAKVGVLFDLLE